MSQNNTDYSSNPTGNELMDNLLAKSKENGLTCNSGVSRPVYAVKGTLWLDTSVTPNLLKQYDGVGDVVLGSIDVTNHAFTPSGIDGKQNILTAGSNIQIVGSTISATDTTYSAGTGISITNGVINNTQTTLPWGNLTGSISNQTDLQTALSGKSTILLVSTLPAVIDPDIYYAIPEPESE